MNNKKNRSFGGVSALILIVLIFLVFWITNQSQQRSRMFTLDEYHESVDSNQVESAVIYQDKAVPTGQVELKLKDSGEYRYVNVSNVQNEQEYLEDAGVRCELDKVPGENVFLTMRVEDTGVGIRKQDMDKLFVSFSQVDSKYSHNGEGTGLGLVITSALC